MRLILKRGKQEELILKAKGDLTWEKIAKKLNVNQKYLCCELKKEIRSLNEDLYKRLCKIAMVNYDENIEKKLIDNWGKSKGGLNSSGSLKKLPNIKFNEKLAEFVGIVLGDGHVCSYKQGKKVGVYCIRIAGDLNKDKEYHVSYIKDLSKELFNLNANEVLSKWNNGRFLDLYSRKLVEFFISIGIMPGNKIKNQSTIPSWILKDKIFLRACLRGLIDTDGSIHRMSKKDPNLLRINFTNHNETLLRDVRNSFIKIGFNPSKIINNKKIYLSRQKEIEKYVKEIGFKNDKHIKRLSEFSLVV